MKEPDRRKNFSQKEVQPRNVILKRNSASFIILEILHLFQFRQGKQISIPVTKYLKYIPKYEQIIDG